MLSFLPSYILGAIASLSLAVNILFWVPILLVLALPKFLLPIPGLRKGLNRILHWIGENWIACNSLWMRLTQKTKWIVKGREGLNYKGWYLVVSNHQSWVDIFVLQHLLNRRIPMLKFFIKRELIKVPLMGFAWWALDYPFLYRHSSEYLKKHPEQKGKDFEATRRACEKFASISTSVMNFIEGTRFTREKHDEAEERIQIPPEAEIRGAGPGHERAGREVQFPAGHHHCVPGRGPVFLEIPQRRSSKDHCPHEDHRGAETADARRLRRRPGIPRSHARMGAPVVAGKRPADRKHHNKRSLIEKNGTDSLQPSTEGSLFIENFSRKKGPGADQHAPGPNLKIKNRDLTFFRFAGRRRFPRRGLLSRNSPHHETVGKGRAPDIVIVINASRAFARRVKTGYHGAVRLLGLGLFVDFDPAEGQRDPRGQGIEGVKFGRLDLERKGVLGRLGIGCLAVGDARVEVRNGLFQGRCRRAYLRARSARLSAWTMGIPSPSNILYAAATPGCFLVSSSKTRATTCPGCFMAAFPWAT